MFNYIAQNGNDLSTIFAPNVITTDVSFSSSISFTKGISSSYIVASSNITLSSNFPNVIYINSATNFNITLPTNPSILGIMMYIRQISGTSPLTIGYPNGIRRQNSPITNAAYMSYSLCSLPTGSGNNWYLFYYV
jgi:hypothetical protein